VPGERTFLRGVVKNYPFLSPSLHPSFPTPYLTQPLLRLAAQAPLQLWKRNDVHVRVELPPSLPPSLLPLHRDGQERRERKTRKMKWRTNSGRGRWRNCLICLPSFLLLLLPRLPLGDVIGKGREQRTPPPRLFLPFLPPSLPPALLLGALDPTASPSDVFQDRVGVELQLDR